MTDSSPDPIPLKFVLDSLEDDRVYSPNSIVAFVKRLGLFEAMDEKSARSAEQRLMDALWQYAIRCRFPKNGDSMVRRGASTEPGWRGRRWRQGELSPEKVFEDDEQQFMTPKKNWKPSDLLEQKGVFFLKDVKDILNLDPVSVKKRAQAIEARGQSSWRVMGARKIFNHWMLRMKLFAPYYQKHFISQVRRVKPHWDGNQLLEQEGVFLLSEVCKKIPFAVNQLRHQAKKNPAAKAEWGIWKDQDLSVYLVDMALFSKWVRELWGGRF